MWPEMWPASIHDILAIGARRAASSESETTSHTLLGPGAGPCYPRAVQQPLRHPCWRPCRTLPKPRAMSNTVMPEPPGTATERALSTTRRMNQADVRT